MDDFAAGTADQSVTTGGMTNVRWRIFFLILGTVAINYIDRASLSVAMPMISREFSISPAIQGILLSSFFWTYCLMQIPGGHAGGPFPAAQRHRRRNDRLGRVRGPGRRVHRVDHHAADPAWAGPGRGADLSRPAPS